VLIVSLARVCFVSSDEKPENLATAETILEEVLRELEPRDATHRVELQQLRWMRLNALKKMNAPQEKLQDGKRHLIASRLVIHFVSA
jgi:hypothetical protein